LQIEEDVKNQKFPFLVVANGGSTLTGSIDDFNQLASICQKWKMWLHVDAAYGGFFMLTKKGKELFKGIHHADSITIDPHKSLFLPCMYFLNMVIFIKNSWYWLFIG